MSSVLEYFKQPKGYEAPLSALGGRLVNVQSEEDLADVRLVLFHVSDGRWEGQSNDAEPEIPVFYDELARLYLPKEMNKGVAILGVFLPGAELRDTEIGLMETLKFFLERNIVPVVTANSRQLVTAVYEAFKAIETVVNLTSVDTRLNLGGDNDPGLIGRIIKEQPNYLFNYTNIGYQTYYCSSEEAELADMLFFDTYRLGEIRGAAHTTEPFIRSSEFFHFSLDTIKSSDFKSATNAEPNGFYSEEVCQMFRYAGLNEKLRMVALTNFLPENYPSDNRLLAQMVWCLLDGLAYQQKEHPGKPAENFLRYSVALEDDTYEIVFFKSLKTDRWWMEVPIPPNYVNRYLKHHLLPCGYEDYLTATRDEVPDRWWKAYQKML